MLEKLGCLELGTLNGHDFSNLSETDLNKGIRNLSTSKRECASCHLQYKSLSSLGTRFLSQNRILENGLATTMKSLKVDTTQGTDTIVSKNWLHS